MLTLFSLLLQLRQKCFLLLMQCLPTTSLSSIPCWFSHCCTRSIRSSASAKIFKTKSIISRNEGLLEESPCQHVHSSSRTHSSTCSGTFGRCPSLRTTSKSCEGWPSKGSCKSSHNYIRQCFQKYIRSLLYHLFSKSFQYLRYPKESWLY